MRDSEDGAAADCQGGPGPGEPEATPLRPWAAQRGGAGGSIYGAALLGPPSPPHPMVSPLPPVVPCGVGSSLPLPTVVAVGSPPPPCGPPAPPHCGCGRLRPLPWLLLVGRLASGC